MRLSHPLRQAHFGHIFAFNGDLSATAGDAVQVARVGGAGFDLPVYVAVFEAVVEMIGDEPFEPAAGRFGGSQVASHVGCTFLSTRL